MRNTNRNKMITKKSNEDYIFIKVNKELLIEFIMNIIFYIIGIITIISLLAFIFAVGSMVESWNITKGAVIISLISMAWLSLIAIGCKMLTK